MIKLTDHITLLQAPGYEYPFSNCLLIEDDGLYLVDSAMREQYYELLKEQPIQLIIGSHGHADHAYRNSQFPQAQVLMHEADHPMLESRDGYLNAMGIKLFEEYLQPPLRVDQVGYRFRPADGALSDSQVLTLGSTEVQVIHLPGHTPGHCGFLFPAEGILFTADIDLSRLGPWYANVISDIDDFLNSIQRVIDLRPEMIIPGHGRAPITKDIESRLIQFRDIIYQREERIIQAMYRRKRTLLEIATGFPVHGTELDPRLLVFELVMVYNHLRRLQGLGRIVQDGDRYYLTGGLRPSNLYLG